MTIDQLTYYNPKGLTTPEHVLPTVNTTIESVSIPSLSVAGLGLFYNAPLMKTLLSLQPPPLSTEISDFCTIMFGNVPTTLHP